MGEELSESGIDLEDLNIPVIYLGTHQNKTSELSKVVIPMLTSFEKSGSFINRNFRLQSFKQSVPGPAGLLPDLHIIASLINGLSEDTEQSSDLASIWKQLSKSPTNPLHGIIYSKIPEDGIQLNGTKWDSLSFVEKKALHFSPLKQTQKA